MISFFCARMLLRAHSRQKMSPSGQATGSTAASRQSEHEAKGRKDSRVRRADEAPQDAFAHDRSYDVKTALLVFLLPVGEGGVGQPYGRCFELWDLGKGTWRTVGHVGLVPWRF